MWIARFAVPVALALAILFAGLSPRGARADATVSAKEVLLLAQRAGGRSYTYTQAIAAELDRTKLARPPEGASREVLEGVLAAAGFTLGPVGPEGKVFRVEHGEG